MKKSIIGYLLEKMGASTISVLFDKLEDNDKKKREVVIKIKPSNAGMVWFLKQMELFANEKNERLPSRESIATMSEKLNARPCGVIITEEKNGGV